MNTTNYSHNISKENYFASPKMPIKDLNASYLSRGESSSSGVNSSKNVIHQFIQSFKSNDGENVNPALQSAVLKMKEMSLLEGKRLQVVKHVGPKETNIEGCSHSRQTNPGYSRNKLGGFYTS